MFSSVACPKLVLLQYFYFFGYKFLVKELSFDTLSGKKKK